MCKVVSFKYKYGDADVVGRGGGRENDEAAGRVVGQGVGMRNVQRVPSSLV